MDNMKYMIVITLLLLLPFVSAATVSESNIDRGIVLNPPSTSTSQTVTVQGLAFNITYQDFAYNQTQAANKSIYELYNSVWRSTFNQTYADFAYNQTQAATTPGGSDTQVQFNDGGSFGGDTNFTFNKTTGRVGVGIINPNFRLSVRGSGTGVADIGNIFGSFNYVGLKLNSRAGPNSYNLLSAPDDPSLYISRPTNNSIFFAENNSIQMTLAPTTGNLGIGTRTPETKVEIATTANDFIKLNRTAVNPWYIGNLGGGLAFDTASINTSAAKFIIESGGDVGISNTNPTQRLQVGDGSETTPTLIRVTSGGAIANANPSLSFFKSGASDGFISYTLDGGQYKFLIGNDPTNYNNANLLPATVFTLSTTNKRIGIATTSPRNTLEVNGTASVRAGNTTNTRASVGGKIAQHFTDRGNVGTAETEIYSYVIPAQMLVSGGSSITGIDAGTFAGSGTATRQIQAYLNNTEVFDTGALSLANNSDWRLEYTIMATNTTNVRTIFSLNTGGASTATYTVYTSVDLNLLANNVLNITGTAAGVGAATDDIVDHMGWIRYEAEA